MTDNEMNEFNSAVRMIDFNKKHPNVFKNNVKMTGGFAALDIEVNTLASANAVRCINGRETFEE